MSDFISRADLAAFLDVELASLDNALSALAVASAQASVRKYLDQEITYVASDERLVDGTGTRILRLHERPVRGVNLVEDSDGNTVDATTYVLRRNQLIFLDAETVWEKGLANYTVTYSHGWNTGQVDSDSDSDFETLSVPADIVLVTLALARRVYQHGGEDAQGELKSESIGDYSYTLADDAEQVAGVKLNAAEQAVLDRYRVGGAG